VVRPRCTVRFERLILRLTALRLREDVEGTV
jgi:hypothetical protein